MIHQHQFRSLHFTCSDSAVTIVAVPAVAITTVIVTAVVVPAVTTVVVTAVPASSSGFHYSHAATVAVTFHMVLHS